MAPGAAIVYVDRQARVIPAAGLRFSSLGTRDPRDNKVVKAEINKLYFSGRNSYNSCMKAVVSEKGQVTIPKKLRERLGIRRGQILEFETRDGLLIGRKAAEDDPVAAVYGILNLKDFDVDAAINEMRGEPWNPAMDAPRAKRR